jgi:hypothetical protein
MELHNEIKDILQAVQLTAEGVTEQNNNLFMMGYRVGYNDMTEINAETKAVLMKLYSTIRNIEITLSCRLLDDETEERVIRVLGDVK